MKPLMGYVLAHFPRNQFNRVKGTSSLAGWRGSAPPGVWGKAPALPYRRILAAGCSAGSRARPGPYSFSRKGPGA